LAATRSADRHCAGGAQAGAGFGEGTIVPLNLIPHIRAAIDDQISNDTDRTTLEVIRPAVRLHFRRRLDSDQLRSLFGRCSA
jgi:hypothetical protein